MLKGRAALEAAMAFARRGRGANKYHVAPRAERTANGIVFASKAEAARYHELELLRAAGHVRFFLRQVPFHLPGRTRYLLDFLVFWTDGHQSFEDVKGTRTEVYELKRRQVLELYGLEIQELGARRRSERR